MFQTIMPLIINTHGHLGILKGTTMPSANYTEENIVLDKNPSESIESTRTIRAVWKNGQKANDGPLLNASGTSTGSEKIKGERR
jgi:hypothetical protein